MIKDHPYIGELRSGASCQYVYTPNFDGKGHDEICGRQAMDHEEIGREYGDQMSGHVHIHIDPELKRARQAMDQEPENPYEGKSLEELAVTMQSPEYLNPGFPIHQIARDGEAALNKVLGLEEPDRRLPIRSADAAQYARPAIPEEQRGQIRVRLLNATPDPLGSVAALIEQYKGNVIRSLSEVTDDQRRAALADMSKTVLSGPLEAVQFHWQIEGVTRSITHQMVRSRASFFAQESLRFAVPEGNWCDEIPLPPSLASIKLAAPGQPASAGDLAVDTWKDAMINAQNAYERLIELGMPAEEARGILPHDMPTRIHWVCDLRTLLAEAGKRTCTQAQFPWRLIFAGMASALRKYSTATTVVRSHVNLIDQWQFSEIAKALRPVCFQTGKCGFMAQFDRSCKIRGRVDELGEMGVPTSGWGDPRVIKTFHAASNPGSMLTDDEARRLSISDYEWAADPSAARS
jgi:flavin-dependent thymidylate synthase